MKQYKIGIVGAAGYVGGELLRLLVNHPEAEIAFAQSESNSGKPITSVHKDLLGETTLVFSNGISTNVDLIFLCMGHGKSSKIINDIPNTIKIIDLSEDFRIHSAPNKEFVYGLSEYNKEKIKNAQNIANPGCFATAIQLALLPIVQHNLVKSDININCTTGSTGAGQSLNTTSHFSFRQNNLAVYKPFTHQHLTEIEKTLKEIQPEFSSNLFMIPQRGAFARGIFCCINFLTTSSLQEVISMYKTYYQSSEFVFVSDDPIDLKQVVNTNKCLIYLEVHKGQLMVISIIDNLLKGAAGQAVQNMNLMLGIKETTGLKLKAMAY